MKILFKNSKSLFVYIHNKIRKKNFIISGGTTIKKILSHSNIKRKFLNNKILLSDERLVKKNSNLRNDKFYYSLIKKKLIKKKNFFNFKSENIDEIAVKKLEDKINKIKLDIAILSLGNNGHIASIFELKEKKINNFYFVTNSPKFPKKRFTISVDKLSKCKKIYLIATLSKRKKEINNLKNNILLQKIKSKITLLVMP